MANIAIGVVNKRIVSTRVDPAPDPLEAGEVLLDVPVAIADYPNITRDEWQAIGAYLTDKMVDTGALVVKDAPFIILERNENTVTTGTPAEIQAQLKEDAARVFAKMFAIVTTPKAYGPDEKDTWGKQERVAFAWMDNWNGGTPTVTVAADQALPENDRQFTVLVNLCAGELKIAKAAVTDQNVFDKAESILNNSVSISDYVAAVMGTLHGVINDLDAVVLTDGDAIDQLLAVDLSVIEAVAAAELGL